MMRGLEAEPPPGKRGHDDGKSHDPLDISPDATPEELKAAGYQLLRSGRPGEAVKMFSRQYAADSSAAALYNTACALARDRQPGPALAVLERSIYAGYGGGEDIERDDDLESLRGRTEFRRLTRLADDLSLTWVNVIGNWAPTGMRSEVRRYERAVKAHPEAGRAWFNLGFVQLRADDAREGRESFLKAIELGYRPATSLYNQACCAAQLDMADEAIRCLERAEKLGMKLWNQAPKDDDLDPIRDDPRYRAMEDRWDRERRADEAEKRAYEKAKESGRERLYQKEKAKRTSVRVG